MAPGYSIGSGRAIASILSERQKCGQCSGLTPLLMCDVHRSQHQPIRDHHPPLRRGCPPQPWPKRRQQHDRRDADAQPHRSRRPKCREKALPSAAPPWKLTMPPKIAGIGGIAARCPRFVSCIRPDNARRARLKRGPLSGGDGLFPFHYGSAPGLPSLPSQIQWKTATITERLTPLTIKFLL